MMYWISLILLCTYGGAIGVAARSQNIAIGSKSVNEFTLSLHKAIAERASNNDNVALSGLSVFTAFSAITLGARKETRNELKSALKWENRRGIEASLGTYFNHLMRENLDFVIANKIFAANNFIMKRNFKSLAKKKFDMKSQNIDVTKPEVARGIINDWVRTQTKGLINEIIPSGVISGLTRMILCNSIYFKGSWASKFDTKKTIPGVFKGPNNADINVQYMVQEQKYGLKYMDNADAIEIPYKGGHLSMFVVKPFDQSVYDLEKKMSMKTIEEMISGFSESKVKLYLPKFEIEYSANLNGDLLGMPTAFDSAKADFGKLTNEKGIYISKALHKTVVKVDEEGTEAASVTAIIFETRSYGASFRVDSPFLFYIIDKARKTIMFSGRVVNPNGK